MYQLKSVSRNYKKDLTYMVGVLRPELVVEYIMELKFNDGEDPDFLLYTNLRYIKDLKEKEAKINCIVKIEDIKESKAYDGKFSPGSVRPCRVMDSCGASMSLLLWDGHPENIDKLGIINGDIIHLEGANTRRDKNGNIILNLGRVSSMSKVTDICDPSRFSSGTPVISTPTMKENNIPKKIVYNRASQTRKNKIRDITSEGYMIIAGKVVEKTPVRYTEKDGKKIYFSKLRLNDGSAEIEVAFWRNYSKKTMNFNVDDYVQISNVRVKYSEYLKGMGGSFTSRSAIMLIEHPNIEVKAEVKHVQMKDVLMTGVLNSKPVIRMLKIPMGMSGNVWTFELESDEVLYLVRIFKSEYHEVMEKLTEGNMVRMDKVNLKNSRNVKYRYEVYVTSKSDFEVVIQ